MKRVIIAVLIVLSMASKCQPAFERKCEEAGGVVITDPNAPEKPRCYKDGKEIEL